MRDLPLSEGELSVLTHSRKLLLLFLERYTPLIGLWRIGCSGQLFFALSLFFGAKVLRTGSDKASCILKGEAVMLNLLGKPALEYLHSYSVTERKLHSANSAPWTLSLL